MNLFISTKNRLCDPSQMPSPLSRHRTETRSFRPFTASSLTSAVTCMPTGVAAQWLRLTLKPLRCEDRA